MGGSFVDEAADVAFRLGQADCLGKGSEGLSLFLVHLVSQSLQELDLNDVYPSLACSCSL